MTTKTPGARVPAQCGTNAAYVRHLQRGEEPCDPCREAHNVYWAAYRSSHPEADETYKKGVRLYSRARGRALRRLAEEFPAVYAQFFAEERAKVATEERAKAGGG